ncbi:hypothetical protein ACQY0O_000791 [Thecaphora frezii]
MSSILQAIFPCCMGRGRRNSATAKRNQTDERTPLIGDRQDQNADAESSHEERPKSLLPQPAFDAEAMRGIVKDIQTKLIPLDASGLFDASATASKEAASAAGKATTKRPLTLVRHLKLHIAEEAALELRLQRETKLRSPHLSGASTADGDRGRTGLRRKKTSGASESRFPSVHSLKTLARGSASAVQVGGDASPPMADVEAGGGHAAAATATFDDDDSAFHTAKEAYPTVVEIGASSRPKLVDIWGTSPPERSPETYASRARRALKKDSLHPSNAPQSEAKKEPRKMTTTQAAEIESRLYDQLAQTLHRQGPLTEVWQEDHQD